MAGFECKSRYQRPLFFVSSMPPALVLLLGLPQTAVGRPLPLSRRGCEDFLYLGDKEHFLDDFYQLKQACLTYRKKAVQFAFGERKAAVSTG